MKITENQLRSSIRSILTELLGGKKKTSWLEDILGQGHGGGYGTYGGYGGGDAYGDYDFYLEDMYGVDMSDGDSDGDGDGDGGE